jgi:hypothetical protein
MIDSSPISPPQTSQVSTRIHNVHHPSHHHKRSKSISQERKEASKFVTKLKNHG